MLDLYKNLTQGQYDAAFQTLEYCLCKCPSEDWDLQIGSYQINQAAFHALIFADLYLGKSKDCLMTQSFHQKHTEWFADYEEFEDRVPVRLYPREFLLNYLAHCRKKAKQVLENETESTLKSAVDFPRLSITRAEMHVYNIRHIQHHTAQIVLRLRIKTGINTPWFKSGWKRPH